MTQRNLDLDAVRTFIHIAELGSFTRAAEVTRTTQSAVSLKLKRLEEMLGCGLIERTPRYVELSVQGAAFLEPARELLIKQDQVIVTFTGVRHRLCIGISEHAAGPESPALISRIKAQCPQLLIEIRIGSSMDLLQRFDRRELDVVIARVHAGRDDGELLLEEKFGWFAGPSWQRSAGEPLPVATMPEPCGVRAMAAQILDEADIPWTEVFVGGGVAAVSAAVMANLGVAAVARRMLPLGAVDVGAQLELPELPSLPILLYSRIKDDQSRGAIDVMSAAFKSVALGSTS